MFQCFISFRNRSIIIIRKEIKRERVDYFGFSAIKDTSNAAALITYIFTHTIPSQFSVARADDVFVLWEKAQRKQANHSHFIQSEQRIHNENRENLFSRASSFRNSIVFHRNNNGNYVACIQLILKNFSRFFLLLRTNICRCATCTTV